MTNKRQSENSKKSKALRVLFCISFALVTFLLGLMAYHHIQMKKEKKFLITYGVGTTYDAEGYNINAYATGDEASSNTIVFMGGLGNTDTDITTRRLSESLVKNNIRFINIDRAGCGMSDDTKNQRSIENIVEEYRTTLSAAGDEAPYVLMAHSVSAMYALYWQYEYPNEVKAIVFVDATAPEYYLWYAQNYGNSDISTGTLKMEYTLSQLGLTRFSFIRSRFGLAITDLEDNFSLEEEQMANLLWTISPISRAYISESALKIENAEKCAYIHTETDIPKLYLRAMNFEGDFYEKYVKEQMEASFSSKDKMQAYIDDMNQLDDKNQEFIESYGNVTTVKMSGQHVLYQYAPEKVAEAVTKFLNLN